MRVLSQVLLVLHNLRLLDSLILRSQYLILSLEMRMHALPLPRDQLAHLLEAQLVVSSHPVSSDVLYIQKVRMELLPWSLSHWFGRIWILYQLDLAIPPNCV